MTNDVVIKVDHLSKRYRLGLISSRTLREDVHRLWSRLRRPRPLTSDLRPLTSAVGPLTSDLRPLTSDLRPPTSAVPDLRPPTSAVSPPPSAVGALTSDLRPLTSSVPDLRPLTSSVPDLRPLTSSVPDLRPLTSSVPDVLWALRDVSFEVKQGEVLGIIGRNGAGKSTLLKILTGVTEPTEGKVWMKGRIASLLEVGTGFHPELTGRENIFLNGTILGMKKLEIARKFDEIIAFSGIERFVDTPVKHYSSGMYVRLAFAVAAHLEPEIMLVDEVLAVGDAQFQKKCLGKMGEAARGGRTVLFVSHNMIAVNSLCRRVIWLSDGCLKEDGRPETVTSRYLQGSADSVADQEWKDPQTAPGNDCFRLHRVQIQAENGNSHGPLTMRTPFLVETEYWNLKPGAKLHITYHFLNDQGIVIFTGGSCREPGWRLRSLPTGLYRSTCHVPGDLLNSGFHAIRLLLVEDGNRVVYELSPAASFEILDTSEREGSYMGREPGAVQPLLRWQTVQLGG